MSGPYEVVVGAGTLRSTDAACARFPHWWTAGGVTVQSGFTGAHLLHLATAGCVLNDVYREAVTLALEIKGVRVTASGDFDPETWQSTGISYAVEVAASAEQSALDHLLDVVDRVAEIPRALRAGGRVRRVN